MTPEEIEERAAILAEGYDDVEIDDIEIDDVVDEQEEVVQEEDPWAALHPSVADTIKGLQTRVNDFDNIQFRLKQAEQRVGSLTNELHAAKKAQEQVKEAPSQKEIEAAAKDDAQMSALKEDWPEWADALENMERKLTERTAEMFTGINVDGVRDQLQTDFDNRLNDVQKQFEIRLVGIKHKGWTDTVKTDEFKTWSIAQPEEIQTLLRSDRAEDVIEALDLFKTPKQKTTAEKRQERLARSVAPNLSTRTAKTKTLADMTPDEQRRELLRQGYEED